jgi:hypothetical protein
MARGLRSVVERKGEQNCNMYQILWTSVPILAGFGDTVKAL